MVTYLLCLLIAVVGLYFVTFAAVNSPELFGYAAAAFVLCVIGMAVASVSIVLSW